MSLLLGCGGAAEPAPVSGAAAGSGGPTELNFIMKNLVNKPFSKLTFFVFHSGGDYNFTEIEKVTREFQEGVARVRAYPTPPVQTEEGRQVFATFLENLDKDGGRLAEAIKVRNGKSMESLVGKLSRTCNNCHHFFRLDIADTPEQ